MAWISASISFNLSSEASPSPELSSSESDCTPSSSCFTSSKLLSAFGLPGGPGCFLLEFHAPQLPLSCHVPVVLSCHSLSCQGASLSLLPVFCGLDFQPLLFCVLLVAALSHLLFHPSQPPSSPTGARAIDDAEVQLCFWTGNAPVLSKGRPTVVRHVPRTEVRGGTIIKHLSQNGYAKISDKTTRCVIRSLRGRGLWLGGKRNYAINEFANCFVLVSLLVSAGFAVLCWFSAGLCWSLPVRVGKSNLGNPTWEIQLGKTNFGKPTWGNQLGKSNLGKSTWENQLGKINLGFAVLCWFCAGLCWSLPVPCFVLVLQWSLLVSAGFAFLCWFCAGLCWSLPVSLFCAGYVLVSLLD